MLTYGVAFQLLGEAALDYLNQREIQLGGYKSHITLFQPKDSSTAPFPVLLYVATPSNQHWLGPERLDKVAEQVCINDLTSDLEIPNNYISSFTSSHMLIIIPILGCIFFRKQWAQCRIRVTPCRLDER